MTAAQDIAQALGGRKAGAGYVARCPAHDDRNPSLSIRDGNDGTLWLTCHAGCDRRDIRAALSQRGLFENAGPGKFPEVQRPEVQRCPSPQSERARSQSALALWSEAVSIRETLAWKYLACRGIDLGELP